MVLVYTFILSFVTNYVSLLIHNIALVTDYVNLHTHWYYANMLRNNLSALMGRKRMKIKEVVELSGISRSTITRLYYGETNTISFNTMEKLCYALDCNAHDLFEYIPD